MGLVNNSTVTNLMTLVNSDLGLVAVNRDHILHLLVVEDISFQNQTQHEHTIVLVLVPYSLSSFLI